MSQSHGHSSAKLPEKQHRREETEMIVSIFDHTSEALAHLSTAATNFSSLAKITNRDISHHPKCSCQTPGSTECAREVPEPCDQTCSTNNRGTKNGKS